MDDKTLITLVEKFGASDLAELELVDGSTRLSLKKASAVAAGAAVPAPSAPAGAAPATPTPVRLGLPAHVEDAAKSAASGRSAPGTEPITSPIVATFYRASGPDAPAFAEVGKKIRAGQTLCILEAMKMMNHLEAEFDCEVVAVLANNGDLVEYGQPLFEVKRL
jgi:acetyl-CoA carboxylase biotin carboxyl carrier protein